MTYINDSQILELSNESLAGKMAQIRRNDSILNYKLTTCKKRGMKGVVWKAKDDLGEDAALKIIPLEDYSGRSINDEVTEATKLGSDFFADIKFFGEFSIQDIPLSSEFVAITTKWIEGPTLEEFVNAYRLSIDDFIVLAKQLFYVLAVLKNRNLCHDDLHPGNVLIEKCTDALTSENTLRIKVIDTGTIKRLSTREILLSKLREKIDILRKVNPRPNELDECEKLLEWKEPDDHLRIMECLLIAANGLITNYHQLDFWERRFVDLLNPFFQRASDLNLSSRLDDPERLSSELLALLRDSKAEEGGETRVLSSPFNYISAEMIRNDKEFAELFSKECPWLNDCLTIEPLYLYGPRGCGKSSVLRWLSFKTRIADSDRQNIEGLSDIGIYVSCSVELRSRFWLLDEETINQFQTPILRFFNLLLLEELFDVLVLIWDLENESRINSGLKDSDLWRFTDWVLSRMSQNGSEQRYRLQGQSHLEYLRGVVRNLKWDTWARIQKGEDEEKERPFLILP